MTRIIAAAALALAAVASSGPVEAKGCLKGAAVGGVAGHMAGHGALGAAAGCVIGRHRRTIRRSRLPIRARTSRRAAEGLKPTCAPRPGAKQPFGGWPTDGGFVR